MAGTATAIATAMSRTTTTADDDPDADAADPGIDDADIEDQCPRLREAFEAAAEGDPGVAKRQPLVRALKQWYDVDAAKELIDRGASKGWIDERSTNLYARGDIFE